MGTRMRRLFVGLLTVAALLNGIAFASAYQPQAGNEANLTTLLEDLVRAYETPSTNDEAMIHVDLEAIRAIDEADYEIAVSVAEHWKSVYLNKDYRLFVYDGEPIATELAEACPEIGQGQAHAIVVLGYALDNGEMTDELKGRCDAAAAMARAFPEAILICSGGPTGENNPDGHTEADLMKAYLAQICGIDAARIHIDERAMTTVDNAVNTFDILRSQRIETMTIVTSTYHQRWGQAVYNAVGAICRQAYGSAARIAGNYCFEIEPSNEIYRSDDRIAVRQIAQILNLPVEATKPAQGYGRKP